MDFSLFISFEATARGKPIVRDLGDVFDKNGDHGGFKQPKSGKHVGLMGISWDLNGFNWTLMGLIGL